MENPTNQLFLWLSEQAPAAISAPGKLWNIKGNGQILSYSVLYPRAATVEDYITTEKILFCLSVIWRIKT